MLPLTVLFPPHFKYNRNQFNFIITLIVFCWFLWPFCDLTNVLFLSFILVLHWFYWTLTPFSIEWLSVQTLLINKEINIFSSKNTFCRLHGFFRQAIKNAECELALLKLWYYVCSPASVSFISSFIWWQTNVFCMQ